MQPRCMAEAKAGKVRYLTLRCLNGSALRHRNPTAIYYPRVRGKASADPLYLAALLRRKGDAQAPDSDAWRA
jgi:hypothetical protein